jgi:hypothetical protein
MRGKGGAGGRRLAEKSGRSRVADKPSKDSAASGLAVEKVGSMPSTGFTSAAPAVLGKKARKATSTIRSSLVMSVPVAFSLSTQ